MTEIINTTNPSPVDPSLRAFLLAVGDVNVFRHHVLKYISARRLIEEAIETMLLALDEIDGDENLEDTDEDIGDDEIDGEPSLGWTATIGQVGFHWLGLTDDSEDEHDGSEPSLGAIEVRFSETTGLLNPDQTWWGAGNRDDREWDDDQEPDEPFVDGRDPIDQTELLRPA